MKPWHAAPDCPACGAGVATPAVLEGRFSLANVDTLWCPACGHDWQELDPIEVARAWWSAGAYAGHEPSGGGVYAEFPARRLRRAS